ncbi:hypothetical protein RhiJN_20970 [Ceratobasidium sp. AG-Ba]|nr:hypothetical protein RhiJN_20970 [Ceratobasidium sp. AG-Ba]
MHSSQSSDQGSACYRVFQVSELLEQIFAYAAKGSGARLLRVSRHMFTCIAPLVWSDTEVEPLLTTIPGTRVAAVMGELAMMPYTFIFPPIMDLTRYNVYAPFIRTLRSHLPYNINFPKQAMPKPLLPNLLRLIAVATSSTELYPFDWMYWFIYPGLLEVKVQTRDQEDICHNPTFRDHPWSDRASSLEMLERLSLRCPRLRVLRMYPKRLTGCLEEIYLPVYKLVASLTQLRSLTLPGDIVHHELLSALGQLPHLESLYICAEKISMRETQHVVQLPGNSFPSLRRLVLHRFMMDTWSQVFQARPLFCNLITLVIIYDIPSNMQTTRHLDDPLTRLGSSCSNVRELTLFNRHDSGLNRLILSPAIINILQQMPSMQILSLGCIHFNISLFGEEELSEGSLTRSLVGWRKLLNVIQHVEELHIDDQNLSSQELILIGSHLPRLRLLVFNTVEFDQSEEPSAVESTIQPITICANSYFGSRAASDAGQLASTGEEIMRDESSMISQAARYVKGLRKIQYH